MTIGLCILKVIDDKDISCEIPATVHSGSNIDLDIMTYIIQTNKLYDRISRQLLSARMLHEPLGKVFKMLIQFDVELQSWRRSLPSRVQPPEVLKVFKVPENNQSLGQMLTHCSYYDLIMITHALFMYPWISNAYLSHSNASLAQMIKAQVVTSSRMVADAARSLIVIARNTDITRAGTQS